MTPAPRTRRFLRAAPVVRLVLDVGGVLHQSGTVRAVIAEMAEAAGVTTAERAITAHYGWRGDWWSGVLTEEEGWLRIFEDTGMSGDIAPWREKLLATYTPQPAVERLLGWSSRAELWAFSNHRSEWLYPTLQRFGVDSAFTRIVVSDAVGLAKPAPAMYSCLMSGEPRHVVYVDDEDPNLNPARALGIETIWADGSGEWLEKVELLLSNGR